LTEVIGGKGQLRIEYGRKLLRVIPTKNVFWGINALKPVACDARAQPNSRWVDPLIKPSEFLSESHQKQRRQEKQLASGKSRHTPAAIPRRQSLELPYSIAFRRG
jgi:hypothetical protein